MSPALEGIKRREDGPMVVPCPHGLPQTSTQSGSAVPSARLLRTALSINMLKTIVDTMSGSGFATGPKISTVESKKLYPAFHAADNCHYVKIESNGSPAAQYGP